MKINSLQKSFEIYCLFGSSLLAIAGGIVGFILGGPFLAIMGIFLGNLSAHFVQSNFVKDKNLKLNQI